jgi:hypothetical protein
MMTTLRKLRNSSRKRENEVFACMIYHLIDEYNYFVDYPDEIL